MGAQYPVKAARELTMPSFRRFHHVSVSRQRGVVLFIALIALVAMSLAAVALIRSVDTATLVAGNLAFKQSATSSGDSGAEGAIGWLTTTSAAATSDPWTDAAHAFNNDNPAAGYYSSINVGAPLDLFADATWSPATSAPATGNLYDATGHEYFDATHTKPTGNTVRYVIERMCRTPNQLLTEADCLFSDTSEDNRSKRVLTYGEAGGANSSTAGSPIYRITARILGPKNTVSYTQAYAY